LHYFILQLQEGAIPEFRRSSAKGKCTSGRLRRLVAQVTMAARSDQIRNFCNNIRAYHEKQEEEQFYDFTIKDKDGVTMQLHKFILASQSEYFAGLFRTNPTASETTFKDFSLEVIRTCVDYLYIHKVNLTGDNVQDVLVFADFVSLSDVTAICIDYIIDNMDESNYTHVMDLGNTRGIDRLVESGVLFVIRNLTQSIDSLDDFTKQMIIKVARWQQQRSTIMTREQWMICQLKNKFLCVPKKEMALQARGSSMHGNFSGNWGPELAINGNISGNDAGYFHSQLENHPWLEVKFPSPILISSLTIINRQNACWERLRNLEIRAGMEPVPEGFTASEREFHADKHLEVNTRCGYFAGPAQRSVEGPVITFDQPTLAQYITLQILGEGILQINGLKINGGALLNCNDNLF